MLAEENYLKKGAKIWLPNLNCIKESLDYFHPILRQYYTTRLVADPKTNPLYLATEDVERKLLKCPDKLTNKTQMDHIYEHSNQPFYVLTLKDEYEPVPRAPKSKAKVVKEVVATSEVKAKRVLAKDFLVDTSADISSTTSASSSNSSSGSENSRAKRQKRAASPPKRLAEAVPVPKTTRSSRR